MNRRAALAALGSLALPACHDRPTGDARRLVLKVQPLGASRALPALLDAFRRANPHVDLVAEPLPGSSDLAHQFLLTALEGGSAAFDVFVADVVWVRELVRAGWVQSLSSRFAPDQVRRDFLPAAAEAVIVEGQTFAVPWYVDVGLLYRRLDLAPEPPATYAALIETAERARRDRPGLSGYVWQGRQYEGLVCNVYEAIWGHGGSALRGERLRLDDAPARAALAYLRALVERGVSPPSVTSASEEEARRAFQEGRAVFMRNWPYAWAQAERRGSPVRGKVGVSALPSAAGEPGPGALGGYQLALNAHTPPGKREAALALIAFLTSIEASRVLALDYGRNPALRAAYTDPALQAAAPRLAALQPLLEDARSRPATPYYAMIADTLQAEFSAAVCGIRTARRALERAQQLADHIMGLPA